MKIRKVKKKEVNFKDFVKRSALESDYEELITEPCILTDEEGKVLAIYDVLPLDTTRLIQALKKINYHTGKRTRGLVSTSRIFGYRPRSPLRGDYCSSTSMASEHPEEHALVCGFAIEVEEYYKKYYPEGWEKHRSVTDEKILPEYKIKNSEKESLFTSGIINKNNPLKYHFDTGNFKDVYSCMLVFKHDVSGGYLSLPEYGVGFELKNNSLFMFDGQSILHGVTPIKYNNPNGHRFSIVYYSLKQIWKCLEMTAELAYVRNKKTAREKARHNMTEEHYNSLSSRRGKQ